jgi:cyclophilin family peptidyl-prolyl cis-trans isomerase
MTGPRTPRGVLVRAPWAAAVLLASAGTAWGQLAPVRECALVGRPILVRLGPAPAPEHAAAADAAPMVTRKPQPVKAEPSKPDADEPTPAKAESPKPAPPAPVPAPAAGPKPEPGRPEPMPALPPASPEPGAGGGGGGGVEDDTLAEPEEAEELAAVRAPSKPAPIPRPDATLRIELINAETLKVVDAKPAKAGEVDLAELFPRLWKTEAPAVLLAQAVEGDRRVGAAVVLVPMIAPRYASRMDREGVPIFGPPPRPRPLAGYWTFQDQHAVLHTTKGDLAFRLRPDAAPASVMHFRDLIRKGFYDGVPVHRVASLRGQPLPDIAQLGDPTGTGHGGPGSMIDMEDSPLKHAYGVLSFARAADPNSAGSQVIIDLSREAASALDGKYAAFGELVRGGATLTALAKTPVDADGRPREPVAVDRAELVDAPPVGQGPRPVPDPLDVPVGR